MAGTLGDGRDRRTVLRRLAATALTLPLAARGRGSAAAIGVDEARIVDATEALVLVEAGVPFVDVRPRTAFEHGHVPGARSLAFEHFRPHRLAELVHPVETFVLYGAGEDDTRGALSTLRAASWGFAEARFFRGGFAAWRAVGGAVERAGMAPRRDLA